MAIKKNADISLRFIPVFMAKLREITQKLSFFMDAGNDFPGSGRVVLCY